MLDFDGILQKEALYCAIGRCAIRLKDELPFDQWTEETLSAESLSQNPKLVRPPCSVFNEFYSQKPLATP